MTELNPDGLHFKPMSRQAQAQRDKASLRSLTNLINSPEFVENSFDGDSGKFSSPLSDPPATPITREQAGPVVFESKIFTTGRLGAGKDTVLKSIGRTIFGFADPLYMLQQSFFGSRDKSLPGAREFLQKVGQWGRGTISPQYPITPERAIFVSLVAAMGDNLGSEVNWAAYGKSDTIWLDALVSRTAGLDNIGVSNVRFRNEREALVGAGFTHYHVMCSPQTLSARHKAQGIAPGSVVLTDLSEHMAIGLDKAALDLVKKFPTGPKLRVIWSDEKVKSPSNRFITL